MIDGTLVLVGYLGPLEPALDSTPLVFRRKESVRCGRRPGIGRARASSGQQLDQPGRHSGFHFAQEPSGTLGNAQVVSSRRARVELRFVIGAQARGRRGHL